ncbi:MAG: hypothetical protein J3K34DRAFT_172200 [Monoraphidium minutum]|nr:MAG: hypothetical protein J3K34DRAFT_172200 [Monoraphidium minutum]
MWCTLIDSAPRFAFPRPRKTPRAPSAPNQPPAASGAASLARGQVAGMHAANVALRQLQPLLAARAADLRELAALAARAAADGRLPDDIPRDALLTGAGAAALVVLALLPRGRRLLSDTVDTCVATALLAALIALLLALPFGEPPPPPCIPSPPARAPRCRGALHALHPAGCGGAREQAPPGAAATRSGARHVRAPAALPI